MSASVAVVGDRGMLGRDLLAALAAAASAQPVVPPGSAVNAADYSRRIAPGSYIVIFGQELAPRTEAASALPLPTRLQGTSVEVTDGSATSGPATVQITVTPINDAPVADDGTATTRAGVGVDVSIGNLVAALQQTGAGMTGGRFEVPRIQLDAALDEGQGRRSEERGLALGVSGGLVSIGIVVGPALGGLILEVLTWHWIFFVNLPPSHQPSFGCASRM